MNRKLKKMLKNTYGAKPERKNSFIRQLYNDPVWRKLHPVSSLIKIPSSYVFIPAAAVVLTIGAGIAVYNLTDDNIAVPEDSDIIMEMTESSMNETDVYKPFTTTVSTVTVSDITVIVSNTKNSNILSDFVKPSAFEGHKVSMTTDDRTSTFKTTVKNTSLTTVTTAVTGSAEAVDSIYYTELFEHIQNIDDLRRHYDDIKNNQNLYGYPDYNYFEDMLRLMCEESKQDFDELFSEFDDYLHNNLSFEVLRNVISMKQPPIIEGETIGIEYVVYNGKPWTVCEVLLSGVYNFDAKHIFNRGDKVKIAMPGGYMPAREYIELNPDSQLFSDWSDKKINATTIYEKGSNQNPPEIGDIFTYMLGYDDQIPDFPVSGCLTRFSFNDMAQFTRNGDVFTSCNSNFKDMYFTLDQINDSLFEFTDIIHDPNSGRSLGIKNNSFMLYGEFDCYSISENGRIEYLGGCYTENGFYPFFEEEDYSVTWTDNGVIIEYRYDMKSEDFKTAEFSFKK